MASKGAIARRRRVANFLLLSALFAAADTGFALDFSKSDALYTDQALTPVEPGGKVGFMVDQSKGATKGAEVLENGDFSQGGTGWNVANSDATHIATFDATAGTLRYQSDTTTPVMDVWQPGKLTVGEWYEVEVVCSAWVSGSIKTDSFSSSQLLASGVGTFRIIGRASNSSFSIVRNSTNVDLTLTKVSVRPLSGRHGLQTNDGLRPLLGRAPKVVRNLLTRTEEFDNAVWAKQSGGTGTAPVVTANYGIAPDGSLSADRIVFALGAGTTTADYSRLTGPTTTLSAGDHTYSKYIKLTSGSTPVTLRMSIAGGGAETITVTDQWQRFDATWAASAGNWNTRLDLMGGLTGANADLLVWGTQLELGSTVTPYQRVGASTLDVIEPVIGGAAQRNLLTRTEEFENAIWSKTRATVVANATKAPDGSMAADKIVEDTSATTDHRFNQTFTPAVGQTYRFSLYAKAAERSQIALWESASGSTRTAVFDLSNGTVMSSSGGLSSGIDSIGDGWYRCWITSTAANTTGVLAYVTLASSGSTSYTGDGTSGLYVWGAQLEIGPTATTYERVGAYWEPAHAVPAYGFLRPDYVDDAIVTNYSAVTSGTFVIAGRNGSYVAEAYRAAGDSTIFITPTAVFNGIAGILKACGDLVGIFHISRTLSASEKKQVLKYYQQRGAGGELVEGAELVVNGGFDTDTNWTKGAGWTISGGMGNASAASSDLYQANVASTDFSLAYVLRLTVSGLTAGSVRPAILGSNPGSYTANGSYASALRNTNGDRFLYLTGLSGFTGSVDNVSVKPLTPLPLVA